MSRSSPGANSRVADAASRPLSARVPRGAKQGFVPRAVSHARARRRGHGAARRSPRRRRSDLVQRHPRGVRRDGCRRRIQSGPSPAQARPHDRRHRCAALDRSTRRVGLRVRCGASQQASARRSCAADRFLRRTVHDRQLLGRGWWQPRLPRAQAADVLRAGRVRTADGQHHAVARALLDRADRRGCRRGADLRQLGRRHRAA